MQQIDKLWGKKQREPAQLRTFEWSVILTIYSYPVYNFYLHEKYAKLSSATYQIGNKFRLFPAGILLNIISDWCHKEEEREREKLNPKASPLHRLHAQSLSHPHTTPQSHHLVLFGGTECLGHLLTLNFPLVINIQLFYMSENSLLAPMFVAFYWKWTVNKLMRVMRGTQHSFHLPPSVHTFLYFKVWKAKSHSWQTGILDVLFV